MPGSKYSKALTVLLIIAIIAIIGILVFIGVDVYNRYYLEKEASDGVAKFDELIPTILDNETVDNMPVTDENKVDNNLADPYENIKDEGEDTSTNNNGNGEEPVVWYQNKFIQKGTISIPVTGVNYPVLEGATKSELEVAIGIQYGPGLNQVGNTVLAGHNYHNGTLFSNNKNINLGDKIYIKDTSGLSVTYTVYEKTEIPEGDSSYIYRDTNGKREITLYSCNEDASMRVIIKAREE